MFLYFCVELVFVLLDLTHHENDILKWILSKPFRCNRLSQESNFHCEATLNATVVEIGPRFGIAYIELKIKMFYKVENV